MSPIPNRVVGGRVRRVLDRRVASGKKQWNAQTAGTFALREDGASTSGAGNSAEGAFYLDPADTPRLRLRGSVLTNATAPVCDFTFRLKPLGVPIGAATVVGNDTGQAVVAGTSAAVAAPGAGAAVKAEALFDCPAAGFYVVEVVLSANMAANSAAVTRFALDAVTA